MSEPGRARPAVAVVGLSLLGFVLGGFLIDRTAYFDDARDKLRGQAGPAGMPDDGAMGRAVRSAIDRFGSSAPFGGPPEALPSSLALSAEQIDDELPVLSIVADDDYLNDPEIGIVANMQETGADWERLATVSLWEDGELILGSRAGLRIHGDSSRYRGQPSYRLHFRPMYGATPRDGGRLLGSDAEPAAAVVVHVVRRRGTYPNIFVFEIARRLGLPTVEFRPARVFLNGEERGIYVLTERVMPDGWGRTHFGDADFFMYVYKGETKPPSRAAHADLIEWMGAPEGLSLRRARERLDVDNLTRHVLTLMFAFTTDWAQGAALLDRNDPRARWFWIHWDMDQSFYARGNTGVEEWAQPVLELITLDADPQMLESSGILTDARHARRHFNDARRIAFNALLEDAEYRRYFVRLVSDVFNHELTPDYFEDLLDRYRHLARRSGRFARLDMGEYLRRRPGFVRAEVARRFGLQAPVAVHLEGPDDVRYTVDGYAVRGDYDGLYYPGQLVRIEVADAGDRVFSHWLVGGQRFDARQLSLTVEATLRISAVFNGR